MDPDIAELNSLVKTAAKEELLPRFARVERSHKRDGSILTEADLAVQRRLSEALAQRYPDILFLGEETPEAEQRVLLSGADHQGLWVLDPLDGTSNFAAGLPFFSISLALVRAGRPVLGIVYDPMRDECFSARRGGGVWLNGEPLRPRDPGVDLARAIAAVDFKRLPEALRVRLVRDVPYSSQRSCGSVALDWCWVAAGRFHVYLHGGQKLWDYAAGCLVLEEAGGHSTTLAGEPVFQATGGGRSAVAALDRDLFEQWCAWLKVPSVRC